MNQCENSGLHFTMFPAASLISWWDIQSSLAGISFGFLRRCLGWGSSLSQPSSSSRGTCSEKVVNRGRRLSSLFLLESNDAGLRELKTQSRKGVSPELLEWKSWWTRGNLSARILSNSFAAMDCRCLPGKSAMLVVVVPSVGENGCVGGVVL